MPATSLPLLVCVTELIIVVALAQSFSSNGGQYHLQTHFTQENDTVQETCTSGKGSWTGNPEGTQLVGTTLVQQAIWQHQHPRDCSTASFFVFEAVAHMGIGAQIDHMASALGVAIEEGRVLLLDFGDVWATGHFCGQHMTVDTCYFKPISSCSLVDVYGEKFVQQSQAAIRDQLPATRQLVHSERIIFSGLSTKEHAWWKVPSQFNTLLAAPLQNNSVRIGGVPAHTYWWKSQAVAYIAQLNDKMSEKLLYLRHLMYPEFTVPPGTVSVHVRHGDKGSEMRLLPDDVYQDKVQELMAMFPNQFPGKVFLSTEDPQTVEHFSSSSLNVSHVFMKRSNHQHSSPWSVPDLSEEMLYSLLNLQLALMCDAWVCTLASMWCTLIDRLRATLECKAGGVYIDGHGHTQGLGYAM